MERLMLYASLMLKISQHLHSSSMPASKPPSAQLAQLVRLVGEQQAGLETPLLGQTSRQQPERNGPLIQGAADRDITFG